MIAQIIKPENSYEACTTFVDSLRESVNQSISFGERLNDKTMLIAIGYNMRPHLRIEINNSGFYFGYRGLPVFKVENKRHAQRVLSLIRNKIDKEKYFYIRKKIEELF